MMLDRCKLERFEKKKYSCKTLEGSDILDGKFMEFLLRYVDHINLWQLGKRFKKIAVFFKRISWSHKVHWFCWKLESGSHRSRKTLPPACAWILQNQVCAWPYANRGLDPGGN